MSGCNREFVHGRDTFYCLHPKGQRGACLTACPQCFGSGEMLRDHAEPCDITPGVWCPSCVPDRLRHMIDCTTCISPNECAGLGVCAHNMPERAQCEQCRSFLIWDGIRDRPTKCLAFPDCQRAGA